MRAYGLVCRNLTNVLYGLKSGGGESKGAVLKWGGESKGQF